MADAVVYRDQDAFGQLVRRHQGRVRGYLGRVAGNAALADDLSQETFIRAWDKLSDYRGTGNFSGWLVKIAHNQFLQSLRKRARDQRLVDRLENERQHVAPGSVPGAQQPDAGVSDLSRFLAVLSEEERSVMVLSYAYGYSHAEIVDITGLPLGTVKSHIKRGRTRVRELFDIGETSHE